MLPAREICVGLVPRCVLEGGKYDDEGCNASGEMTGEPTEVFSEEKAVAPVSAVKAEERDVLDWE